jgi:alpha-beta hydrolase superfamily lysophospholipase
MQISKRKIPRRIDLSAKPMRVFLKIGRWLLTVAVTAVLTVTLVTALADRRMSDLSPEHRVVLEQEFTASQERDVDWEAYRAIEAKLAVELGEKINSDARSDSFVDRYSENSLTYPGNFSTNWNYSYELTAASAQGVAVLMHGLSDSPYSMRSVAQTMVDAGYTVVVPRMPGHGFAVGGLLGARWEDWAAAVRIAVRHAARLPGADESLVMAGYSNGGLMAIDFALRCDEDPELPCPDGLVLFSPAIAVTPLAVISNWHALLSWMPYFEKSKWLSILPEVDPFKFTSFPKRAAWEIYKLSTGTYKQLRQPAEAGKLPPILTFQSVVDNTVSTAAIVTNLYSRLPANGSELVIYDVNRNSTILHLMDSVPIDPATWLEAAAPLPYGVTVIRNQSRHGPEINLMSLAAGQTKLTTAETDMAWPEGFYSMSHIAVPFRADDPVYGDGSAADDGERRLVFGNLAPRGEEGVLRLQSAYFLRTRYNPFFSYQAEHLQDWLSRL